MRRDAFKGLGKERLLKDRSRLMLTLRDYEAGKSDHLGKKERDIVVENVKRRIADLNDRLKCVDKA